jgi:NADH-quinone oxidoreductase subunit F
VDLRLMLERPTEAERAAVDALLGADESFNGRVVYGGHSARAQRHLLLPALHALQDAAGAISKGGLAYVCERLTVPPADAYGVATFYGLFDVDGAGGPSIHVCDDIVCAQYGAEELCSALDERSMAYHRSPCLGQCDRAPAAMFHEPGVGYGNAAPVNAQSVADPIFEELPPGFLHQDPAELVLLSRVGVIDPESLESYRKIGGFATLTRVRQTGPDAALAELKRSNLRGRGGAAFPLGVKWEGVRDAPGEEKYVVANGDESEPGTFKDRLLMEADPFALVEAMAIFGFVTGATKGYIYVRGEYPTAERRLHNAIFQAEKADLLGDSFALEVRRGAGAYICGEETALFASIEGLRGEPRQKPPFPTQAGVFGKPTGINNIETLFAALAVLANGAEAFRRVGTEQSSGPKLFCVSGSVERPGVYEVPFGTSLGDLLELAGGIRGGRGLDALLMGGAAGVFADSSALDVPLTFEDTRAAGLTLGSGSIIFFDDTTDFGPVLRRIARFFRDESCGQCVPCRIGTVRQEEALARIQAGQPLGSPTAERKRLEDLAWVMTDASICGLGQTASSAVQSAMRLGLYGVRT